MNREDIIKLAREAAAQHGHTIKPTDEIVETLTSFATLIASRVAAAERNSWPAEMEAMERQVNILTDALAQAKAEEREACAELCDSYDAMNWDDNGEYMTGLGDKIRARGET
jgi:hypothetical protein